MSDDNNSLGTNLLLFLVGAAAGAILVALTTPKSGPELRSDVKDLAGRLKLKMQKAKLAVCPECGEASETENEDTGA